MNRVSLALLVYLFPSVVSSQNCDSFKKKWETASCHKSLSSEWQCYNSISRRQRIEVKNSQLKMFCDYEEVDESAILCSQLDSDYNLTMVNCKFSNTNFRDIVGDKEPVEFVIEFKENKNTQLNIRFGALTNLSTIVIRNVTSSENFPIVFGEDSNTVTKLEIDGHNFKSFARSFNKLKSLETLTIRHGPLEKIKQETLFGVSKILVTLDLTWNAIREIQLMTFQNLKNLKELYLTGNSIVNLRKEIFSGLNNLLTLMLNRNKLSSIQHGTFSHLKRLKILNISYNPLTTIPQNQPFGPSLNLNISAINCNFTKFPKVNWGTMKRILNLDLSNNFITNPKLPVCSAVDITVKLHNNGMSIVYLEITICFPTNTKPKYFLSKNALKCDCNLRPFIDFVRGESRESGERIFPDFGLLYCKNTKISLKNVNIYCPRRDCQPVCGCHRNVANCNNMTLTEPPSSIPERVTTVLLVNNNITSLKNAKREYWNHVRVLNVSKNFLTSLDDWDIPENLEVLDLSYNRLEDFPRPLMEIVEESQILIYVSNNNWYCNCKLVVFKEWLMENKDRVGDYEKISCKFSLLESGTVVAFIKDAYVDNFCKAMRVDSQILFVILPIILVAIAVFMFYYKYTLLALLHSWNLLRCTFFYDPVQNKTYDAFVCGNVADRAIVIEFIRVLEPLYQLCIPERDWPKDGKFGTSYHVSQSLKNSRSTLILISKNSLQETWFQVKIRGAYNQRLEDDVHKMILITVGDIRGVPTKHDIREIIASEPSLEWGERWFWQKLCYELRRRDRMDRT